MMDDKVIKYLIKKSGESHPVLIANYVQQYADHFRKLARISAYDVSRGFTAEVPPELEDFINGDKDKDRP